MNEIKVRRAVRNLAVAKALVEESEKSLAEEGFCLCTGNIVDVGWQILPKSKYHPYGIEELAEVLGKAIEEEDERKLVKKSGTAFYEYGKETK